jgi:undecaprenyl-diphosphatase
MLERILYYERDWFLALNGSNSSVWDYFIWLYSGVTIWIPLAAIILLVLMYKKDWRNILVLLVAIALVITLCDQLSSGILKPLCHRFRPTHHPLFADQVHTVLDYRGGQYGFISSHAANAFGFATFIALLFRYKYFTVTIFIWAALSAYSRIYLGVHFISDIIPGIIAGVAFGFFVYYFYKWVCKKLTEKAFISEVLVHTTFQKQLIIYGILLTVLVLFLFDSQLVSLLHQ